MDILTTTDLGTIDQLAASHGIPAGSADYLIYCDGSGAGWDVTMGWACVIYERKSGKRKSLFGAASVGSGSGYHAELLPILFAIQWICERVRRFTEEAEPRATTIHIVTDSKAVADCGVRMTDRTMLPTKIRAAGPLWAAIAVFERSGLELHFHWAERLSSALNSYADDLAGLAARAIRDLKKPVDGNGEEVSVYDCNPADGHRTVLSRITPKLPKQRKKPRPKPPCSDVECA